MRSPLLRLAAGLLLLAGCKKDKNGPTYNTTGTKAVVPSATETLLLASAAPVAPLRAG